MPSRRELIQLTDEEIRDYLATEKTLIYATTEIIEDPEQVVDTLVDVNAGDRELDADERAKLREAVAPRANKRVLLRFKPERYVTWDHAKLGGRY